MKVCTVTTWPPYREGVAIYSAKLYAEIAKHVQVEIVANKINSSKTAKIHGLSNITVRRGWTRGSPLFIFQVLSNLMKPRANVLHLQHGWFLYGKALTALSFPLLILLLRLSRKPVVVTMHTIIRRDAQLVKGRTLNAIASVIVFVVTRCLVAFASRVIVHNTVMKRVLEEHYNCRKGRVFVIPHGVDRAEQKTHPQTSDFRNSQTLSLLSLGFLRKIKTLELLLEAFHELQLNYPRIKLIIVGSGHPHDDESHAEKVRNIVINSKSKGEVALLNFVEEESLNEILVEADIVILLSQETDLVEASGALARVADFEKPVLCSRVPKFQSELADGYNCIMVDAKKATDIYTAIDILIREAETRKRIAQHLKKSFTNRYWNVIAKKHVKLYRSILPPFKPNNARCCRTS